MEATYEHGKERIHTVDMLKGLAIIGVVVFHVALSVSTEPTTQSGITLQNLKGLPYSLLCTFIVISGYFYRPGHTYLQNLRHRILKFVICIVAAVVILNTLMFVILWAQGYDLTLSQLWEVIWKSIVGRGAFSTLEDIQVYGGMILAPFEVTHPLYYLQMLVVGYLIFYAIVDRVIDDDRKFWATVIILVTVSAVYVQFVGIVLPFYAHLGPMAAAFLLVGYYLSKKRFFEWLETAVRDKRYWGMFFACLVTALLLCLVSAKDVSIVYCHFGPFGGWSMYTFFILSLTGGMAIAFIVSWFRNIKPVAKVFSTVGMSCLAVYLLHVFVAKCLCSPFVTFDLTTWFPISTLWALLLSFVTVFIIVAAVKIFEKVRERRSAGSPS